MLIMMVDKEEAKEVVGFVGRGHEMCSIFVRQREKRRQKKTTSWLFLILNFLVVCFFLIIDFTHTFSF